MRSLVAFITGLIFALGLGLSGMTDPAAVRGFLDVFGNWSWQLMGVMAGAIGVHAITFRLIMKRKTPILEASFHVPTRKDLDGKLILGAVLFGIGWGLAGICPGPGLISLASGQFGVLWFVISMLIGMGLFLLWEKRT